MPRDDASLVDIVTAARLVREFVQGLDRAAFEEDILRQSGAICQLEIIGEAAKRVSEPYKLAHPEIPWRKMAGLRDILIHAYDRVDIDELWNISQTSVPELIRLIEPLVPPEESV